MRVDPLLQSTSRTGASHGAVNQAVGGINTPDLVTPISSESRINIGSAPGGRRPRDGDYKKIIGQVSLQATSSIAGGQDHNIHKSIGGDNSSSLRTVQE